MPCPDFQSFLLPMLQVLSDGAEMKSPELRARVAVLLKLGVEDMAERVASGKRLAYVDRSYWACTYLTQAGLVTWVRRGVYQISTRGTEVLETRPARIDLARLREEPLFRAWIDGTAGTVTGPPPASGDPAPTLTPGEQVSTGWESLKRTVEAALLAKILAASPEFFENLVVELLVKMGYGGSQRDAGQALGRSGDGGIDGIIKEDRLGLDAIYVQAKRWDPAKHKVSRPDVQSFAGSLEGVRARKGVFITTSGFSAEARDYVSKIEKKIVLLDGAELAALLFEHNVGVRTKETYEVKEVDEEFFLDD